ncbi:MAG TPA: endonuclease III [Armatimonadota bacterium]|nr:endonuclease III [Armatimonadota bacterium]
MAINQHEQFCRIHGAGNKKPHDIDVMMDRVQTAVRPFPKAAMFELADEGFNSPFEQLVACIISIRTLDETTVIEARRLFEAARTPQQMVWLAPKEIEALISKSTFHEAKAPQIHTIARRIVDDYNGQLPCDSETIQSFRGVGVKCANLVLGISCNQPRVSADVHVHRITNRWGYIDTKTPEESSKALEEKLPKRYWVDINRLLVPFGKHICTGKLPYCSTCPLLDMCQQVGVMGHR